ncbi:hypothetical protein EJ08DRAFT_716095 [Tothia fuscella]|uniref:Uncharacterized protein n=1 Tax=Tothia fuscella TaxID=1048955 RepID=A0A9P4TY52_9PEZI|nr:hypothetical protein EJ08DRAFT_716095 [Tothia fuscella]
MPTSFQGQFALSVELTRLIPLGGHLVVRTVEEFKRLVKALPNSGSNIIVEEDLAKIFGRS